MAAAQVKEGLEPARWQRSLLPGSMVDGPGADRSLRDWAVDILVTATVLGVGALALGASWEGHGDVARVLDVLLGLAAAAALWDRRRHPIGVAAFAIPVSAVSGLAAGAALVAVFNIAIRGDRRALAASAGGSLVAATVYSFLYASDTSAWGDALFSFVAVGFAVGWGLFIRVRRDLVGQLHERAARLEEEGRLRADQARAAERERIAREMHDVLAHRLSLLSLHAGALEYRPDAPPAEIEATAGVVRESAAAALEELRDVIGILREGTDSEARPPQPTLTDLPQLIEESRAAGMRIDAELDLGDEEDGAGPAGRTAYRIVQEGLTNARKHAPGTLIKVRVAMGAAGLEIEVRNRAPLGPAPKPALPGAGSGLIGLGERIDLAGGTLRHAVAADGDFVLTATLPRERRAR